jgi:hypothetical protein
MWPFSALFRRMGGEKFGIIEKTDLLIDVEVLANGIREAEKQQSTTTPDEA